MKFNITSLSALRYYNISDKIWGQLLGKTAKFYYPVNFSRNPRQ